MAGSRVLVAFRFAITQESRWTCALRNSCCPGPTFFFAPLHSQYLFASLWSVVFSHGRHTMSEILDPMTELLCSLVSIPPLSVPFWAPPFNPERVGYGGTDTRLVDLSAQQLRRSAYLLSILYAGLESYLSPVGRMYQDRACFFAHTPSRPSWFCSRVPRARSCSSSHTCCQYSCSDYDGTSVRRNSSRLHERRPADVPS